MTHNLADVQTRWESPTTAMLRSIADVMSEQDTAAHAETRHWQRMHHEQLRKYDQLTLALSKRWGDEKVTKFLEREGLL